MEFKLNIGCPKTKKCFKKELKENDCKLLIGKKIGDSIKGEAIDFPGYEFQITGGSDNSGFPMRWDVDLAGRKKILISSGVGLKKKKRNGIRLRKTVAGNKIHDKTVQINMKIIKYGKESLDKPAEEEKPAETPSKEQATKGKKPVEEKKK